MRPLEGVGARGWVRRPPPPDVALQPSAHFPPMGSLLKMYPIGGSAHDEGKGYL